MKIDSKLFEEYDIRLEKVICLSMQPDWNALSDDTIEFLEEFESVASDIGLTEDWIDALLSDEDYETLAQELFIYGFTGVFGQFSQPMMTRRGASSFVSFSWGVYQSKWFYGPTFEDLAKLAIDWGKDNKTMKAEAQ